MKKDTQIRFGLIGCGRIAPRHAESIVNLKRAKLEAVCDIEKKKALDFAEEWKVQKVYYNYLNLLEDPDIDVVSICTPNGLHAPMGIDAAKAQKHALIEKPIATNSTVADKLITAFKKHRKKLFVVKQVRYNPAVVKVREVIKKGKLGKIISCALTMRWTRPDEYFKQSPWRGTKQMDGGALLTQGIHYLDLLQWFFGPVEKIMAKTDRLGHKNIEIEDVVSAILKFKSNALGTIEFTICTYPHNLECSLTVLGEKGSIKIGGDAVNEIELWKVKNMRKPKISDGLKPNVYAGGMYQGSCPNHIFVYRDLIATLLDKKPVKVDGKEARKSLEIAMAIYRSSELGREVSLPL